MTISGDKNPRRPTLVALKGKAITLTCDYGDEYEIEEIECIIDDVGEEKIFLYNGYPSTDKRKGTHTRGWILLKHIVDVKAKLY